MADFQKISVIGLGYVGLPTAAVFASYGVEVIGVDVNADAVATINRGSVHIIEPDLEAVVHRVVTNGKLRARTTPEPAEAFLIAVPTPVREGHVPDVSYVEAAARAIAPVLTKGNLVVLESTSPVGTTEKLAGWLAAARPDLAFPQTAGEEADVQVGYCPERVLPGHVLRELVENDRIIGGMTPRCAARAQHLYRTFVQGECLLTNARTAEMAKLTENSFRDVNIAFANELSIICEKLNINVWELIELANRHPRVKILQPGPGVGGHCIAVDPWFIVNSAPAEARLIRTAREVNDHKPVHVLERIQEKASRFRDPKIACLGLSYKPDIDDLRESPALHIVEELAKKKIGHLLVVEPHIDTLPKDLQLPGVELVNAVRAVQEADIVVLLVNHRVFKDLDAVNLKEKIMIDTRGFFR